MSVHLCVLIHGLWGNPSHLKQLRETLVSQHPQDNLHVLVAKSNADSFTYDGVNIGGERIAHEIEETLSELKRSTGKSVARISIIGYSLGGLVARYTIGLLYQDGVFDNVEPVNFTTFATPHLGVKNPSASYLSSIFNTMGAKTLSASGQQLFLTDSFEDTGKPLLSLLADRNSVFMKGMALFKNKSLYANTINDRSVPWFTAGITRTDPFVDTDKIDLHYLQDPDNLEEPVLLDPHNPVTPIAEPKTQQSIAQQLSSFGQSLPFYAAFAVFAPIGVTGFLANSVYQNYTSAKRMRLHLEGGSGIDSGRYRVKSLLEEAQAVRARVQTQFAGAQTEEYLPTPPPEPADDKMLGEGEPDLQREASKNDSPFPTLALTPEQFAMIDSLDTLGIKKYPVNIQRVRHTHAAIVVRMNREAFSEGKVVLKHWAKNFEV